MPLHIRRIIFSSLLLIFFIAGPLLILMASGYRYDFEKNRLVKTGILVVSAFPNDYEILIDGVKTKGERFGDGILFNNLIPKDYEVIVKKDGYISWQKKLRVERQHTTFADHIVLFQKNEAKKILDGEVVFFETANDKTLLALKEEDGWNLGILSHKNQRVNFLNKFALELTPLSASFSSGMNKILIASENGRSWVLDTRSENAVQEISSPHGQNNQYFFWPESGEYLVYQIDGENIYKHTLSSGNRELLVTIGLKPNEKIKNELFLKNNDVYFFIESQDNITLAKKNLLNQASFSVITMLPRNSQIHFLRDESNLPNFYDSTDSQYYFFDESGENIIQTLGGKRGSKSKKYFLVSDGYEITLWNNTLSKNRLISRQSQIITSLGIIKPYEYGYFSDASGLLLTEFDARDRANQYLISDKKNITRVVSDEKGTWLFFLSSDPESPGLFGIQILDESAIDFFSLLSNTSA